MRGNGRRGRRHGEGNLVRGRPHRGGHPESKLTLRAPDVRRSFCTNHTITDPKPSRHAFTPPTSHPLPPPTSHHITTYLHTHHLPTHPPPLSSPPQASETNNNDPAKEVEALEAVRACPFITQLWSCVVGLYDYTLLLEYCPYGTLEGLLRVRGAGVEGRGEGGL